MELPWYSNLNQITDSVNLSLPVISAPRFTPTAAIRAYVKWITMAGEKIFREDELGALYCSVTVPTCRRRGRAAITEVDAVLRECATP
jgi:hypothetical protein